MFTRHVVMKIKPDCTAALARIVESAVAPSLRAQRGCRHEETFITPELREAVLNSYWDTEGYAEAYHGAVYPAALAALAGVIDGTPQVESFGISSSTFHEITANRRLAYRDSQLDRG
jgi:quinol monooxygenase YgiN